MEFPEFETRNVDVGEGVQLCVAHAGEGGAPLLLVHGFTGSKEDFFHEVEPLVEMGFHVVVADHRGHGSSDQPSRSQDYSLAQLADDMFAVADAFGWSRFDLLGHSMGGMVVQLMVLERPDRVGRLILMDTHHGQLSNLDADLIELGAQIARTDGLKAIQDILKLGQDPLDNPAFQRLKATMPGYEQWSDSKMLVCSPEMYATLLTEISQVNDRLDLLMKIDHPTLVLVGELDEPFIQASQRMANALPNAKLVMIDDAGHSPQFENTTQWRDAVHAFLAAGLGE